jgi:hypothetical protein
MARSYPVHFDVAYPLRRLDRLTTFLRPLIIIPIALVLAAVAGTAISGGIDPLHVALTAGGLLVAGPLLMIVFRRKYPRWWFDYNQELLRFSNRVWLYGALLDDRYPSTDEQQSLKLDLRYPDAKTELNRVLPLFKWLLAIPHYIVLAVLHLAAVIAVIAAWFSILFTGRYPQPLFDFVVGVGRWTTRVVAYAFVLSTDQYPPFRLAH